MSEEREIFLRGLPLLPIAEEEWEYFREQYLGKKTPSCPDVAQLFAFAQGKTADPEGSAVIQGHARSCDYCKKWLEGFAQARATPSAHDAPPAPGSMLESLHRPPAEDEEASPDAS